jgi:hypothetical protein
MSYNVKIIVTIIILWAHLTCISALKTFDVQPYINQVEERLESMAKPSPEIVEEFVKELQVSCKSNLTIDMNMMVNWMNLIVII